MCFVGFVPNIAFVDVVGKVLGSTSQVGYPKGCFVMNPRSGLKMNPRMGFPTTEEIHERVFIVVVPTRHFL